MPLQTLNCPMCGAPAATEATKCQHCGARLATVSCPHCFAMMFLGAKFCSRCGTELQRAEAKDKRGRSCPRCQVALRSVKVGATPMHACERCDGLWVNAASFEMICANRERQSAVLGKASVVMRHGRPLEPVCYAPCPECRKLMNRVNFANCSGVIVDVCKAHGTWFDKDELTRIVDFIRSGGMETSRAKRREELEQQERHIKRLQQASASSPSSYETGFSSRDSIFDVVLSAGDLMDFFNG